MAFFRDQAKCPFCGSAHFSVKLFVNDMPMTDDPSVISEEVQFCCTQCGKKVFMVTKTQGGHASAVGVSTCEKCQNEFFIENDREWRELDIPRTTYPIGTDNCPRCGSRLRICWWRGWNYSI